MRFSAVLLLPLAGILAACAAASSPGPTIRPNPHTDPLGGPSAGTSGAQATYPAEAQADTAAADHVLGTGTPESITEAAFRAAVAAGGKITFNGGTQPFTITLTQTAKLRNDHPSVVIDGGNLVTLSGAGAVRILYLNTADQAQVWTTPHAQNQDLPHLTVQNLTFVDGYAPEADGSGVSGGGAIYDYGGRLKIVHCRFFHNGTVAQGPDVGGGAVRVFAQYNQQPVYVVDSTFGGPAGYGNFGSNGGALSSISVNWAIYNSVFTGNQALGYRGNPADAGTAGGGSGGAIYNDGNTLTLSIYGSTLENNTGRAYGAAIFFVADDNHGTLRLEDSILNNNTGTTWDAAGHRGISFRDSTTFQNVGSTIP